MTTKEDRLPQTLSYFIFNKLRGRIITGELAPGQALREQDLEVRYGSSRGPIRESLRMLLQTGLVEHQERRGFRVRSYTATDVENIYRLRATLEGMVIDSLAGLPLDRISQTLTESCQTMACYYEAGNVEGYFEENTRFHQLIINYTENRVLSQVMFYVNEVSLPPRYKLLAGTFLTRRSLTYHEQITHHIGSGDLAAAHRVTVQHILENLGLVLKAYAT